MPSVGLLLTDRNVLFTRKDHHSGDPPPARSVTGTLRRDRICPAPGSYLGVTAAHRELLLRLLSLWVSLGHAATECTRHTPLYAHTHHTRTLAHANRKGQHGCLWPGITGAACRCREPCYTVTYDSTQEPFSANRTLLSFMRAFCSVLSFYF